MNARAPKIVAARGSESANLPVPAGHFDPDFYHAMDERDSALIRDEALHGSVSQSFVYQFKIQGTQVTGVSVVGARHLMHLYQGLQHRIVASAEKKGPIFKFVSYPAEHIPMQVTCSTVRELADEEDYINVLVEVKDIKTGNSIQAERSELRFEKRRDGSLYERPNYSNIAQSKAYRNAVLNLLPQDVIDEFKKRCLSLGQAADLTEDTITEKRRRVLQFAARHGVSIDRQALQNVGWDQISGLSAAVHEGGLEDFVNALDGLGLIRRDEEEAEEQPQRGNGEAKKLERSKEKPVNTAKKPDKKREPEPAHAEASDEGEAEPARQEAGEEPAADTGDRASGLFRGV